MTITLKREGTCADCGAKLNAGTRARWYRDGRTYGFDCHQQAARPARRSEPLGQTYSRLDPGGFYTADGRLLGRTRCGCEDYPCCGH